MFLGIDLGTSSIKAVLADQTGTLMDHESAEYPVCYPHEGWSEQSPQDWLEGLYTVLAGLGSRHDLSRVEGISFCGQMHGLVVLDKADQVIRPALLWHDNRTVTQTDALNREPGRRNWFAAPAISPLPASPPQSCSGCGRTSRSTLPVSAKSCCPRTTCSTP